MRAERVRTDKMLNAVKEGRKKEGRERKGKERKGKERKRSWGRRKRTT